MTKSQILELMDEAIVKWQGMQSGKLSHHFGVGFCSLCDEFRVDDNGVINCEGCHKCPLSMIGQGCLTENSAWKKWYMDKHFCAFNKQLLSKRAGDMVAVLQAAAAWCEENYHD